MDGRTRLAKAFGDWIELNGWTQTEVVAMGGPSTTTQTKVTKTDDPISRQTLKQIDLVMGWPAGTSAGVLAGATPPRPGRQAAIVSAPSDDQDTILYRRPEGMSEAQWERLRAENSRYWQWQLSQTDLER